VPPPPEAHPFLNFRADGLYVETSAGRLSDLTSMPEPVFRDWLREAGLEPPGEAKIVQVHDELSAMGLEPPDEGESDALSVMGLEPPVEAESGKVRDWPSWWDQHAPRMTDQQRAKVWQALDRLRFYEIVETELED